MRFWKQPWWVVIYEIRFLVREEPQEKSCGSSSMSHYKGHAYWNISQKDDGPVVHAVTMPSHGSQRKIPDTLRCDGSGAHIAAVPSHSSKRKIPDTLRCDGSGAHTAALSKHGKQRNSPIPLLGDGSCVFRAAHPGLDNQNNCQLASNAMVLRLLCRGSAPELSDAGIKVIQGI